MNLYYRKIKSPIGTLHVVARDSGLVTISFDSYWKNLKKAFTDKLLNEEHAVLDRAVRQLEEYFSGERRTFDIPLDPEGTPFQKSAWEVLQNIPFGETISYGEQAKRLKKPLAVRAVGAANGKNPIPIVVPCHRVIGSSGALTGYAGGLDIKKKLLEIEGIL